MSEDVANTKTDKLSNGEPARCSSAGYAAISVHEARQIGEGYQKDMVLILAYDHKSGRTHATTWGRGAADKAGAVNVRNLCLEAIGVCMAKGNTYQDFRYITEAERAKVVDALVRACRAADHAIASVMAQRDGITDQLLGDVRENLKAAIEAA